MRVAAAVAFCSLLSTGCATRSPAATDAAAEGAVADAVAASSGASGDSCPAVAKAMPTGQAVAALPRAGGEGRMTIAVPARAVAGREIRARYLVDPTGQVHAPSIEITGVTDSEFRRELESMILRTRYRPPVAGGCPSWARGDFRLRLPRR